MNRNHHVPNSQQARTAFTKPIFFQIFPTADRASFIVYNTPAYVWKYISNKPFYGNPKGVWLATNDMDIMSLN